jgi:ABC-type Mn2+/Zn2+ transport system ATPase subunit
LPIKSLVVDNQRVTKSLIFAIFATTDRLARVEANSGVKKKRRFSELFSKIKEHAKLFIYTPLHNITLFMNAVDVADLLNRRQVQTRKHWNIANDQNQIMPIKHSLRYIDRRYKVIFPQFCV